MSAELVALGVLAIAALLGLGARRSHRDLVHWLRVDPFARQRALRAAALAAAAALVGFAGVEVSRRPPEFGGAGADLVLAIDVSRSMDARDTPPSRLRRATRLAERVVSEASGLRLALVLVAGDAFVALPLTQDSDAVLAYLAALDTDLISDSGTDLVRALDVAGSAFEPGSSRPRQLLLFSDGEHGGGSLEAPLERLAALGVRAVVVGFGTPLGSDLPGAGADPLANESGEVVVSRREDGTLRRIAAATSGAYYREAEDRPATARLLPRPAPASAPPRRIRLAEVCIALAAALLAAELALSIGRRRERDSRHWWSLRWPARWRARLLGASAAISALSLLAIGPLGLQARGDAELEAGNPREALSQYHKLERSTGATAATRLRVGNAHFRLGQLEQAESAYLSVLSELAAQDPRERFVAAFNLGTALLTEQRFAEARDALWQALLEDPESLEAKFNYEWALERVPPEEEPTVPPPPEPEKESGEREEAKREQPQEQRSEERPRGLDESEAERWLESIEESPGEPMRRQAQQMGERSPSSPSSRQSW